MGLVPASRKRASAKKTQSVADNQAGLNPHWKASEKLPYGVRGNAKPTKRVSSGSGNKKAVTKTGNSSTRSGAGQLQRARDRARTTFDPRSGNSGKPRG